MNVGVRSIAYLYTVGEKKKCQALDLLERTKWMGRGAGWPHAPSAAIVVEHRSIVVLHRGLHATTGIAVGVSVAVQSGRHAIGEKKDCVSDNCDKMGS